MENKILSVRENRQSFMQRLVLRLTPREISLVEFAYDIAKYGHRMQFRDSGIRYFEHLRATAIILIDELHITDADMIIAGLLHDMLEDSFLLTPERITLAFGQRVSGLVDVVTKPKKGDRRFSSNEERHRYYFDRIRSACPEAKILKLADRLHNIRTLDSCQEEKRSRKREETVRVYFPLLDDLNGVYRGISVYLRRELEVSLEVAPGLT